MRAAERETLGLGAGPSVVKVEAGAATEKDPSSALVSVPAPTDKDLLDEILFGTDEEILQPAFDRFADAGFESELVQILPADLPPDLLSARVPDGRDESGETLFREATPEEKRLRLGKAPGKCIGTSPPRWKARSKWQEGDTTRPMLDKWRREGGNVGLRARRTPAVDVDVHAEVDRSIADVIEAVTAEVLGAVPVRCRDNSPGRLMLYRLKAGAGPIAKQVLKFKTPSGNAAKVEILGDGQQAVVAGTHPTGAAIRWRPAEPRRDELPEVTRGDIEGLLTKLRSRLEALGCTEVSAAGKRKANATVPSAPVLHDETLVEEALRQLDPGMPHDPWRDVGMALHSADPDPAGEMAGLFSRWSAGDLHGGERPSNYGQVEERWGGFEEAGGITIATLFDLAKRQGWRPPSLGERAERLVARLLDRPTSFARKHAARLVAANGIEGSGLSTVFEHVRRRVAAEPGDIPFTKGDFEADVEAFKKEAANVEIKREAHRDKKGFIKKGRSVLEDVNRRYFIADEQGDIFVCGVKEDIFDPAPDAEERQTGIEERHIRRRQLVHYSFEAWKKKYARKWWYERTSEGPRRVTLGEEWIGWPGARQYDQIAFYPGQRKLRGNVFNLWQGFAIEPAKGDWTSLREHISKIVCAGSKDLDDYVMGWLRRLVQFPAEPAGTALVLRGKEGTGKSILGYAIRRCFGQHALRVSNALHLVGNFNAHLRDCVFLQADEAFFAGDRKHASVLKSLVTDDSLFIEPKGVNGFEVRNLLHVLMTSNEEWVVPAGPDARRYCVIDVSDRRRGDHAYFAKLGVNDDSVIAAMLHDLLAGQLDAFDVRSVPDTKALQDQKTRSMSGVRAWLHDFLSAGGVDIPVLGTQPWRPFYSINELFADFERWAGNRRRFERPVARETFGKELAALGFEWKRRCPKAVASAVPGDDRERPGYHFGELVKARGVFCAAAGLPALHFEQEGGDDS